MNPENRSRSSLGPLPRRSAWLAGASVVLVLAGIASPAAAAAHSPTASDGVSVASPSAGDDCLMVEDGKAVLSGGDNCRGDKGDKGPKGDPGPCNDIDLYNPFLYTGEAPYEFTPTQQFAGLLFDRDGAGGDPVEAWAGIRNVPALNDDADYQWADISEGLPKDACSIAVADFGMVGNGYDAVASVQVLTKAGYVWETICELTFGDRPITGNEDPSLECDAPWTELGTPGE
jgi:hypothetical protein